MDRDSGSHKDNSPQSNSSHSLADPISKHRVLYFVAALILLLVFFIAVPMYFLGVDILIRDGYKEIVFAVISLCAAVVTFGIIGDSTATMAVPNPVGTGMQLFGSAAGFAIFYLLLSYGLQPYRHLTVYLTNEQGELLSPTDGEIEVRVASRVAQVAYANSGQVGFLIPRSEEDVRLFATSSDGRFWAVDSFEPHGCVANDRRLNSSCQSVSIKLRIEKPCLSDFTISSHEPGRAIQTTLRIVLNRMKEDFQRISPDLDVRLEFSEALLADDLFQIEFPLNRKVETPRNVCDHLSAIENAFNWNIKEKRIWTAASCNRISVGMTGESIGDSLSLCQ